MARAAARARRGSEHTRPVVSGRVVQECAGILLLGASLLAGLALLTSAPGDPVLEQSVVAGRAGVVGATLAAALFGTFGHAGLVLVGAVAVIGTRLVMMRGLPGATSRFWLGTTLLLVSATALPPLLQHAFPGSFEAASGGSIGGWLAVHERWLMGSWGALLLNALVLAIGILGAVGIPPGRALTATGIAVGWTGSAIAISVAALGRAGAAAVTATVRGIGRGVQAAAASAVRAWGRLSAGVQRGAQSVIVWREQRARRARVAAVRAPFEPEPTDEVAPLAAGEGAPVRVPRSGEPAIVDHSGEPSQQKKPQQEAFHFEAARAIGSYQRPDISIFQRPPATGRSYDRDSLIMNSRILEKKLQDFGVSGHVVTVHPGPVVTMYEFEPASGIKVNRIVSLADDLALALRALSVRIIAPLPGKSVVGIEVANSERETVYLRDLLEAESFRDSKSSLLLTLGKDIFGNPAHADLAKMPHLLVAGATGTGKSVFLNALLCSILCRATPDELKLLLIDPKLLELSVYEGIPHLIADVVTNPKRAAAALHGIVHKMEERYQMMAALGVRSIDQFNSRVDKELAAGNTTFRLKPKRGEEEGEEVPFARIPYIVVVIDELADLMVVSARDVEEALQRLAQMARAAGIHLVLATQRPSVDVLTGIIKANFPARISFQVSSRTDSRTILDQNGADHLLGQGDMLFLPPGTSKLQRMHGAFVTEEEVAQLAEALRKQGAPSFDDTLIRLEQEAESKESGGEDVDEMYDKAIALVAETRNASISYIQRRLKVGYNRAARMIEQMENEGVVGPQIGTRPRDVFVRPIDP